MATAAQIAANRINGSKGGPRTEAGKLACRDNAMKHALTSRHLILAEEDASSYEALHGDLVKHYEPESTPEGILVDQLAQSAWRLLRARRLETATFEKPFTAQPVFIQQGTSAPEALDNPDHMRALIFHARATEFDNLRRHEGAIERAYYRAYKELEKIRKERSKTPRPTAPIETVKSEIRSDLQNSVQPPVPQPEPQPPAPKSPRKFWYRRTNAD